jgi:hypothetical protein
MVFPQMQHAISQYSIAKLVLEYILITLTQSGDKLTHSKNAINFFAQ